MFEIVSSESRVWLPSRKIIVVSVSNKPLLLAVRVDNVRQGSSGH